MSTTTDYDSRIRQQVEQYRNVENVHDLPDIFHYWAGRFLAPAMTEIFGTADPVQIFFESFVGCAENPIFLSIGAGDCTVEVEIARRLKASRSDFFFECAELSDAMLERGRSAATAAGVIDHMIFTKVDINGWQLQKQYAGVMAHHSLHHIVELESVFDQVDKALHPRGRFVISDIIGRNGHMRWPEAESIVERIWQTLPDNKKYNHQLKRLEPTFINWDCSKEGFEGVRAQDILALLIERFDFDRFMAFGNLTDVFVDRSFGHNFDSQCQEDREFIDRVHFVNEALIDLGGLKPTMVIATMTRKGQADGPARCYRNWQPEFCVRRTDVDETLSGEELAAIRDALSNCQEDCVNYELRCEQADDALRLSETKVVECLACSDKLAHCQQQLGELQLRFEQAHDAERRMQKRIEELYDSTSWRVTAPLRWLRERLGARAR